MPDFTTPPTAAEALQYLTTAEVARRLNCGQRTVTNLIQRGDLPAIRLGVSVQGRASYRVRVVDLVAFLELMQVPVPVPSPSPVEGAEDA